MQRLDKILSVKKLKILKQMMEKKLLKENPALLLGTDCHNLTDRQPDLGPALACLRGAAMDNAVARAMNLSEVIWSLATD